MVKSSLTSNNWKKVDDKKLTSQLGAGQCVNGQYPCEMAFGIPRNFFLGIPRNKGLNFHGKFGLGIPRNSQP